MKLSAYLRVSTDAQAERGLGMDVQEQAVRAWAKREGHKITLWARDEGLSGSNGLDTRVGLLEAVVAIQDRTVQGIVVYRLDRLARDLVLQESLLAEVWKGGGRVFSTSPSEDGYLDPNGAEDDPSRALIRQILGAVNQYERSMIRLRLRAGRARKREQGGYADGPPPLGYRAEGGVLVPDQQEQATVARIVALRATGASLRGICGALTAEGLAPKRGQRWHPETVRAILARETDSTPS